MSPKIRIRAIGLKVLRFTCAHLPRSNRVRHVLLDSSSSSLAASYLEEFRQLFAPDPRLHFFKFIRPTTPKADQERCLIPLNCPEMAYRISKFYPWDLIVMADHPEEQIEHQARFGVLRISHGIGSKLVAGHDYLYGPGLYGKDGRLRYSRIFEASESRRTRFIAANPDLRGIISLVGDLRIDKLVQASNRAQSRSGEIVRPSVIIASSWSRDNLFEKMGRELLAEAAGLLDRYSFILRPHPHLLKSTASGEWKSYFREQQKLGFVFSPPTDDLGWLLSAASVFICDDLSSLVLYAAVLGKRIIIVPSGSAQIPAESFLGRLTKIVPNLTRPADLPEMLASVLRSGPAEGLSTLAAEINSRPGESARLMRSEFYRLVNLAPLAESQAAEIADLHPHAEGTSNRRIDPVITSESERYEKKTDKLREEIHSSGD
jgi:hypothetical protein